MARINPPVYCLMEASLAYLMAVYQNLTCFKVAIDLYGWRVRGVVTYLADTWPAYLPNPILLGMGIQGLNPKMFC